MRVWLAAMCLACFRPSLAETKPVPQPPVIAAGSSVRLIVKLDLKSGVSKKGDPVLFEVAGDVRAIDGTILLPKGTQVSGSITRSENRRSFGRPGKLEWRCDSLRLPDGRVVPLITGPPPSGEDRTSDAVGTGLLAGRGAAAVALVSSFSLSGFNQPAGFGAGMGVALLAAGFSHGKDIVLKAGQEISVPLVPEGGVSDARKAPSSKPAN